jgi:hypothetical protein
MSLAVRHPEAVATAAGHSNGVGFALTAQNVAAATATVGLSPATADEVSGLTATQFTARAGVYRGSKRKWPQSTRCSPRFWAPVMLPTRLPKPPTTQSQVCKRGGER